MGDEAPLETSLSRMVKLYAASGLKLEEFAVLIDKARVINKRRSNSMRDKERMHQLFGVL